MPLKEMMMQNSVLKKQYAGESLYYIQVLEIWSEMLVSLIILNGDCFCAANLHAHVKSEPGLMRNRLRCCAFRLKILKIHWWSHEDHYRTEFHWLLLNKFCCDIFCQVVVIIWSVLT